MSASLVVSSGWAAEEPAAAAAPVVPTGSLSMKSVAIEVTVIRFKPAQAERVMQSFDFPKGASNVVDFLRPHGSVVDVLYRGSREVLLEPKSHVKFDATESRPVVLVGQPGAPVPPATLFGLTLDVTVIPASQERFGLVWEGSLTWSPDLMDRRKGMANVMSFVGKASAAAQSASKLAGENVAVVNQAADIGLALAQIFQGEKPGASSIYELPVVKTVQLSSGRYCHSGDMVVISTAAEAGTKEPQIIYLLLEPVLRL